jgi:hypothetical protein
LVGELLDVDEERRHDAHAELAREQQVAAETDHHGDGQRAEHVDCRGEGSCHHEGRHVRVAVARLCSRKHAIFVSDRLNAWA